MTTIGTTTTIVKHLKAFDKKLNAYWVGSIPPCDATHNEEQDAVLSYVFAQMVQDLLFINRLNTLAKDINEQPTVDWWRCGEINHVRAVLCRWWLAIYNEVYGLGEQS